MAGDKDKNTFLRCSFCGKTQDEVKKLVAGPTVYICNECVALCNDILKEEDKGEVKSPAPRAKISVPKRRRSSSPRSETAQKLMPAWFQ